MIPTALFAAWALAAPAGDGPGGSPEGAFLLPEINVVATRLETDPRRNAARVESFQAATLDEASNSSATLSEWISAMPGVGSLGRDPFTSAPTIRGLGRGRSLVLVEGVNVSSDRGVGPGLSFVDPALVGAVDVVHGASGVAYGSGAMGGVMAVELGMPDTERGMLRAGGGTHDDERHIAGAAGFENLGAFAGGFYRTRDDYEFPEEDDGLGNAAENSGGTSFGGAAAMERDWSGGTVRVAGIGSFLDDIGRATTIENRLDTVLEDDHALGSVAFRRDNERRRLEGLLGFHRPKLVNRSDRFDGDTGAITRRSDTVNESFDVNGNVLLERPLGSGSWLAGGDTFLRTGVEAQETTTRYTDGVAGEPEAVDLVQGGLQSDTGVFAGWKKSIRDRGQLLLAARGDWSRRSADNQETTSFLSPSLNASVVVPVGESVRVSGILARTFRAPQIQEMYFEGNRPSGFRQPNPDLEPETAYSLEGGVELRRVRWSASGAVWGVLADQFIAQLPVDAAGDTLRFENVSEGRILGVDAGLRWIPRDGTEGSIAYAYVHGEDEDGAPLPDIPAGEITIAARQRVWSQQSTSRSATIRSSIQAGGAKKPTADGSDEAWWSPLLGSTKVGGDEVGHRGFALWNVGLLLRVHRAAAFDVAVTNLLDARQIGRPEPDAYPDPGRSLHVELRLGY